MILKSNIIIIRLFIFIFQVIVDLGCQHITCLDCFSAYIDTIFYENRFVFRHPYGYTVTCPVYNCSGSFSIL